MLRLLAEAARADGQQAVSEQGRLQLRGAPGRGCGICCSTAQRRARRLRAAGGHRPGGGPGRRTGRPPGAPRPRARPGAGRGAARRVRQAAAGVGARRPLRGPAPRPGPRPDPLPRTAADAAAAEPAGRAARAAASGRASPYGPSCPARTTRRGSPSTPPPSPTTPSRARSPSATSTTARPSRGSTRPASSWPSATGELDRLPLDEGARRGAARRGVRAWACGPGAQGGGLGKALTTIGLRHLAARGLPTAMLYVDADNNAAVSVYERLGFVTHETDLMYRTET